MTIVAIDVDVQQGFSPLCPDELPVENALEIVPELNYQAQFSDYRVLTKDAHNPNAIWIVNTKAEMLQSLGSKNADLTWVAHTLIGTKGFNNLPNLPYPDEYDFLVYKGVENDMHPYGACFHDLAEKISTGLIEWLKDKKTTIILVGGLATDYCVKHTVLQLLNNNKAWQVIVNLAACRGIDATTVEDAIQQMSQAGAIIVNNRYELENRLK